MDEKKKEISVTGAMVFEQIANGELTLNQARELYGLERIDCKSFNLLYEYSSKRHQAKAKTIDKETLNEIFEGSKAAISIMEKVFKDHAGLETVIISPNSWVGKEMLSQSRRMIDLRRDMQSLAQSINILIKKVDLLQNNSKERSNFFIRFFKRIKFNI